jgi:ABC-2 type transport system permease protein
MEKIRKALLPVLVFAKIDTRRIFRDKMAIFFVFLFPLIFLFIFGSIFGRSGDVTFNVALINDSKTDFAKDFASKISKNDVIKVKDDIKNIDQANESLGQSQIDAAIVLPESFGAARDGEKFPSGKLEVIYSKSNEQAGQTLSSIMQSVLSGINKSIVGDTPEPFTVEAKTNGKTSLSSFDYLFPGLIGFTILGIGIFGPTSVFPRMKERGILRRYHTTTLRTWQFFLGNLFSNSVAAILSVALMIAVALTVPMFDLNIQGSLLELAVWIIFGTVVIFGIGLGVGGWAKNENQAAPLVNLIVFPMMFLSGTFFPRFLMPEWLQSASNFLPLTPFIDGVRMIIIEGQHIWQILPQVGMLALWGMIIYLIAFRVFRWE